MKIYISILLASLALMANLVAMADNKEDGKKEDAAAANKTNDKYIMDQKTSMERHWLNSKLDLYPQEKDQSKKLIHLDEDGYTKSIVDSSGKFVADRPWFVTFINSQKPHCNMIQESLQHLAYYYQGDVQFAFMNRVLEEKMAYTYEVYGEKESFVPRSFFIDKDGVAHTFPLVLPAINTTIQWIDDKKYKNSPLKFKAPAVMSDMKLKWGYLKKEVRLWYLNNLLDKVEELLRKTKVSYVVDLDPMDFDNSRPYQKMDRQIIFILGFIGMALESIWDWIAAAQGPKEKKFKKSFMDSSLSDEDEKKPEKADGSKKEKKNVTKKSSREKLD